MNPLPEKDRQVHAIVEAALRTYPRAQAPARFAERVMKRLKAGQSPLMTRPEFQFPWWELLACMIFLATMGTVWLVWLILPPEYAAQLRAQGWAIWQQVSLFGQDDLLAWLIPLVMLLVVALLGGAALMFRVSREWQT